MILKNKKLLAVTSALTLLPIPVGLLLWDRFPETMAIHFGFTGQPDGYASPVFAVFGMPLIMLAIHWLCIAATALDKGNQNRNRKLQSIVLWTIPLICNLSCGGMYALALGVKFSPVAWTMIPMGILFMLIGNYMPKTRTNATMGIKIPWTYSSEANWNATHRFGGRIWVIGGFLMALCGFLPHAIAVSAMLVLIIPMILLPVVYSWRFYKKELAEGKNVTPGYRKSGKQHGKFTVVFIVVLVLFLSVVLFCGEIQYDFREDHLLVNSNMYTDYVLSYDSIERIEYREHSVPGLRVGGYGSFRLLMGYFENSEFGIYTRYTYYDPESCVVVYTDHGAVVLSAETPEETKELHDALAARCR